MNSQYLKSISVVIISRYSVTNPDFLHIKDTIKKCVLDYNEKLTSYLIICKWNLHFSDAMVTVKSDTWHSASAGFYLGNFLLSKNKYFENCEHKFYQVSGMNITFIADLRNMTYEHYLKQPKPTVEWNLKAIIAKNPELMKTFGNSYHPLIRQYQHINNGENEDLIYIFSSNLIQINKKR